ncbi:hypothetical protein CRE_18839 [Caenorhabditis remanei]|uniref:Coiled-coil domain-containing protein 104 n=1 Tax=Caenorhabditis remanei TaxID=31234 RepID=E3LKU0_CAERE|nr:hypothetical protein CRE_18839 [Caenorhabditis remanei]
MCVQMRKSIKYGDDVALEPLLAAQNFNVFVPMMMRKNIELQLQALQMIEFMCGLIPSVLQLEDGESLKNMKKLTPEETERYVLISVLRHSKDEYDAMHKGSEELEQMAINSRIQREALEKEIRKEDILIQKALSENRSRNQGTSTQTDESRTPLRTVAAIMAATFSIDTGTSTDDVLIEMLDDQKKNSKSFGTMTTSSSGVSAETMTTGSSETSFGTTMMSSGVDFGTDAAEIEAGKGSRPKSAKRVGSAVGKRSGSASRAKSGSGVVDDDGENPDVEEVKEKRSGTSSKKSITTMVNSDSNTEEVKRPGTSSKKSMAALVNSESNTDDMKRPETGSKTSKTGVTESTAEIDSEGVTKEKMKQKRPGTAKGPNERKYSNAGLEDVVGPPTNKNSSDQTEPKSDPKSRPSTRKSSRTTAEESSSRPPSRKTTASHEPRTKTPLPKSSEDRPTTRRSSVDKNAPKRNDSVPRERRSSMSQKDEDRKPPKPMGPIRSNKYDGDVVLGRPGSPGMDHGPRRKNLNDVNAHLVDSNRLNSSDVRTRAQYLRDQRDKLLQLKNQERIKQMNDIQNSSLERPKTAARAREILDKDKKEAESIRREISKKLKTQILTLH